MSTKVTEEKVSKEFEQFKKMYRTITLGVEGEGVNTEENPSQGGVSKYGVTQVTLDAYNKKMNKPRMSVKDISLPQAEKIAYEEYYVTPGINKLPEKVREYAYDFGYQSSPARAIKYLQAMVGASPDGVIGPKTIKAINDYSTKNGVDKTIDAYADSRMKFLSDLGTKSEYHRNNQAGYQNRVYKIRDQVKSWKY